jgi:hypothetical protein
MTTAPATTLTAPVYDLCMVGQLLLLQGSISNLTCRIDFDSTQLDLDTCSCRFVHRIAHRKNIFKTMQQSSLRWRWSVDKRYHTRIKQNYEVSKTCATPSRKIKKHNKSEYYYGNK